MGLGVGNLGTGRVTDVESPVLRTGRGVSSWV
jgi:hypothetical protein